MDNNRFDDYIRNNKDQFDTEEVPSGLWDKIDEKRSEDSRGKIIKLMPMLRRIAAVVIFGLAIVGVYSIVNQNLVANEELNFIPPEIEELGNYYEKQVHEAMDELTIEMKGDKALAQEVSTELKFLDDEKNRLLKELRNNVDNEQIVEELIKTYRLRLEVLEDVLSMLKEINQHEDFDNEDELNI